MKPKLKFLLKTGFGVFALFFYCEYLIYFFVLIGCSWPELNETNLDTSVKTSNEDPVRVMVLADTHLLGSRHGHWFDKLRREWQMHRAFQTAVLLHRPDLVFVLGDLTDEGLHCGPDEFDYYVRRFHSLFKVPNETQLYVTVGNHDIGFHYRISPYLNERFVKGFNSTSVQLISIRGIHFVLVNSMALEGDGCFLCRSAELELGKIEKIIKCSLGTYKAKCNVANPIDIPSRPILMQHYPLYRKNDMDCDDYDAAPLPIKKDKFREKWDCLSKEATDKLLKQLDPRLAVSGHVHHGCTKKLSMGNGLEITIPSFSWRNKENPTYSLFVFTSNNYAISKCAMPNENTVIRLYIFGGCCLLVWLLYSGFSKAMRRKLKLR